ncbi:MAG: M1 family metallopeptidase [Candidatus Nomurabacteria bacterium]|jgi:aminopeptidase N|nr:M1 family metallopeptidase [Candidatus Nomurabacteria bacterium]
MKKVERLVKYFTPERYLLDLTLDKNNLRFSGIVNIHGLAKDKTIKLHQKGLTITKVEQGADPLKFEVTDDALIIYGVRTEAIELVIKFSGAISEQMHGCYLSKYQFDGFEERVVATQFESHFARECFPCVDEPEAKAIFSLRLITDDEKDTVLSNMPILKQEKLGDRQIATTFAPTPRMSTYLLAFVVGKFHKVSAKNQHGVTISTYAPLNQPLKSLDFANQIACESLDFYSDKFESAYPLPKLDQVALPDFEAGAMENWGLVTYRESFLLFDETVASVTSQIAIASVIAHELSHQWFGNLVTMAWWDDLWLNESFATMMATICLDAIHPEWKAMEDFWTAERPYAMDRDSLQSVQPIKQDVAHPDEIQTLFDGAIVYSKGACLMFMLKNIIGEEAFYKGLADYFKDFAYTNAVGDNLWHKLSKYTTVDILSLMNQWLSKPNYPVIAKDGSQKSITGAGGTYPVPTVTDDLSGYYVLDLNDGVLENAVATFSDKTLEQKLRILMDSYLLAKNNLLKSAKLLPILQEMRLEQSEAVWFMTGRLFKLLQLFIETNSPTETRFRGFMGHIAKKQYKKLGWEASPKELAITTELRMMILSYMIYSERKEVIAKALSKYAEDLIAIDKDLRSLIIATKIKNDFSEPLLKKLLLDYKNATAPDLKEDICRGITGQFKHLDVIYYIFDFIQDFGNVRPQDTLSWLAGLLRNTHTGQSAWKFVKDNWGWLEKHFAGGKGLGSYPRVVVGALKTAEDLKDYKKFFGQFADRPELSRDIALGIEELEKKIKLIANNQAEVETYLAQ